LFYNVIKFIAAVIFKLFFRIEAHNVENIPLNGKLILCSNHSSNLDPILISIEAPRQISWMAKKELFKTKILSYFINKLGAFPVDREGSDISAIKKALRVLKDEKVLGIFPEGTRVKSMNLENVRSGVSLLGFKSKSPILPVYIKSNYKIFSKVDIYFGQPFYLEKYIDHKPTTEDYIEMSQLILSKIYGLKD